MKPLWIKRIPWIILIVLSLVGFLVFFRTLVDSRSALPAETTPQFRNPTNPPQIKGPTGPPPTTPNLE